jgi:hypothetical protein
MRKLRSTRVFRLCLFLLAATVGFACNVPVFRYALERWEPDPFQLVIFHRDPLPAELTARLKALEPVIEAPDARPNWKTVSIDVSKPIPALYADLHARVKDKPLPHVALCTPEWTKSDPPMAEAAFNGTTLDAWLNSPKRAEISSHLLKGTAVIWVILETAEQAKNDELADRVAKESARLAQMPLIPPNLAKDGVNVLSALPIEVSFATVRFRADDPSEAALIRMLTDGHPVKEPTLYPLFGRGRALAAMPASTANSALLEETARFLCGACSCQVKAQNPGFDLLFHTRWENIFGDDAIPAPERPGATTSKPVYVPIPKGKATK